jgi:hypothetical protein
MNILQTSCAVLLLAGTIAHGALYSTFSSGTVNAAIPDGNPNGMWSSIQASGLQSVIRDVNVYLNVAGGFNGDLYAYLSYGNGAVVLLNRIGNTSGDPFGSATAGLGTGANDFGFDDAAATDIHTYALGAAGDPVLGLFQPDRRAINPQWVLDTSLRGSGLSAFNGLDPNGTWTLFLSDMAIGGGDSHPILLDWSLEITSVPEPANPALAILAGLAVLVGTWRSGCWKGKSRARVRQITVLY